MDCLGQGQFIGIFNDNFVFLLYLGEYRFAAVIESLPECVDFLPFAKAILEMYCGCRCRSWHLSAGAK